MDAVATHISAPDPAAKLNRHPEIYVAELRHELLAEGADRIGIQWQAVAYNCTSEHLDTKAVIEHFGIDALQPFMRAIEYQAVRLQPRPRRQVRDTIR
jgi:hypothetical protein